MAERVFNVDELATRIAAHLVTISKKSAVALALTCRVLEDPALRALWETRDSLGFLFNRVLPTDAYCYRLSRVTDLRLLVSPLSSSQYPTYSSITKNFAGVTATTYYAGVG